MKFYGIYFDFFVDFVDDIFYCECCYGCVWCFVGCVFGLVVDDIIFYYFGVFDVIVSKGGYVVRYCR